MPDDRVDALDSLIDGGTGALALPVDPSWRAAIRSNLDVTLRLAASVAEFELPDESEPAAVFEA